MKISPVNYQIQHYQPYKSRPQYITNTEFSTSYPAFKAELLINKSEAVKQLKGMYASDFQIIDILALTKVKSKLFFSKYSAELLETIKAITDKSNIGEVQCLINRLRIHELDNYKTASVYFSDILKLLNADYNVEDANTITWFGLCRPEGSSEYIYDSAPALSAIKHKNSTFKYDYYDNMADATIRSKFYPEIYDTIIELKERGFNRWSITRMMEQCIFNGKHNINLIQELPVLQDELEPENTSRLLRAMNGSPDKKLIKSLLSNIPDGVMKEPQLKGDYILQRLKCSGRYLYNDDTSLLDSKAFDFYNHLYNIAHNKPEKWDFEYIHKITNRCLNEIKSEKFRKKYINLTEKVLKDKDLTPSEINGILHSTYRVSDEETYIIDFVEQLFNKGEKHNIVQIMNNLTLGSSFNKSKIKRLYDFQKEFPNKNKVFLSSVVGDLGYSPKPEAEKFAKQNIDDENLEFYLRKCFDEEKIQDCFENINICNKLLKAGFNIENIEDLFDEDYGSFTNRTVAERNFLTNKIFELIKLDISLDKIISMMNVSYKQSKSFEDGKTDFDLLLKIRNKAIEQKDILSTANEELTDDEIDEAFITSYALHTYKLLGEKTFFEMFKHKIDCVEDYMERLNLVYDRQELVKIINPIGSEKYISLQNDIIKAKSELKNSKNKQEIISRINALTAEKNQLLASSVKDPQNALKIALIYRGFYESKLNILEKLKTVMAQKTPKDAEEFKNIINDSLFEVLNLDISPETKKMLDFHSSRYLEQLFLAGEGFIENFQDLVEILDDSPEESVLETLNNLEQNKETKKQFEKLGIKYDKWVKFDPNSYYKINIKTDLDKMKQSSIKNLESDLNDELYKTLPIEVRDKISKALKKNEIEIKEASNAIYEGDGFYNGNEKKLRLYKNGKPIVFEDMKSIIQIFKTVMSEDKFWTTKQNDKQIENARVTMKDHILQIRYNEVKNALNKKSDKSVKLKIQKADMNNIQHALFLGNDASCCTKVGDGSNEWTAPNYIKNKLVSAIEIIAGENSIGNTMCYIAKVNGKESLILDNIEIKPKYQFNDNIRDAIIKYSKQLCLEIGKPNMPIYAGPNRHKVNFDDFELKQETMQIIGSTGDDEIYLDFNADENVITGNENFEVRLYKLN